MQTLPISKVKDKLNELVDAAATTREQVTITKNRLSWIDSHSSTPISTAAGDPFLVIVTCSRVVEAASTSSLSLSLTLEIGRVCMYESIGPNNSLAKAI